MPYDYQPKILERWDFPAQAETYRLKFEHAQQEKAHWQRTAAALKAQVEMYQAREKA